MVFPTAVNLGQGFMNWKPPAFILDELTKEMHERVISSAYSLVVPIVIIPHSPLTHPRPFVLPGRYDHAIQNTT